MSEQQFLIVLDNTVGCYAHDADGQPWATFEIVNGSAHCAVCGKEIARGWMRGKVGENFHVCSEHVREIRRVPVTFVAFVDQPYPVIMEDEPIHRLPDHPFCDNPECWCHQDDELFSEYVEKPVQDGLLAVYEAVRIYWHEDI